MRQWVERYRCVVRCAFTSEVSGVGARSWMSLILVLVFIELIELH